jgi:tetratricopeptide (TPR) repeat protein
MHMAAPKEKSCGKALRATLFNKSAFLLCLFLLGALKEGKAQKLLPEQAPRYRVIRQVFDRLTYVFANSRPQPQLQVLARSPHKAKIIAQYIPGHRPLIKVDEEVFELCQSLGKDSLNALAVLLSHELAHHYRNHDWYDTFGIGQTDRRLKDDVRRMEAEADFYGCFYGELAGYATGFIFPTVLDLLYQNFQLDERMEGYLPKAERKAIYQKMQNEAAGMVAVFKAGQFLYLIKEFDSAARCFDYLVNLFPSREILHNLSAAKLQQALLLYYSQAQNLFVYPIELDARSRLATIRRLPPTALNAEEYQQLLAEARKYAEKSRETDPEYVPAYINLACIHLLLGNEPAAVGVINELSPRRLTGNAHTMRGIAYYQDRQPEKARQDFEAARQQKAYLADYNLDLFNRLTNKSLSANVMGWVTSWFMQNEDSRSPATPPPCTEPEKNDLEVPPASLSTSESQVMVSEKPYLIVRWQEESGQLSLLIQITRRSYLVQYHTEQYPGKTARGVKSGTFRSALVAQYGKPTYSFAGASGEYWVYRDCNLAFEIGKQVQVKSWLRYAITL